jgi:tetratricopeptide (TPR) repeat protein
VIDQEYPEALVEFGESLERFRRLGDLAGQAKVLWGLGSAELYSGDLESAERDLSESVLRFRRLDDLFGLGWALHNYGHFALLQGDYPTADARLTEALLIFEDADDFSGMALVVDRIAELAAAQGDTVTALRLAGAAAAFQSRTGAGIGEAVQRLGGARPVDLSDREAEAAWSDGQRLSIRQAVEEARTRRHVPA